MQVNRTQAVASMVIDRILGLLGLFLLAGIAGRGRLADGDGERPPADRRGLGGRRSGFLGLALLFTPALTGRSPASLAGHGRLAMILRELM